jgi:hypothetical protein
VTTTTFNRVAGLEAAQAATDAAIKYAAGVANASRTKVAGSQSRVLSAPAAPSIAGSGAVNGYPCGGDLPSCCTLWHESHGIPTIIEGNGSPYTHASGLWQFMPSTWANFRGYPYAAAAPAGVQNEKAALVFDHGRGASNWYGDGCYGGR